MDNKAAENKSLINSSFPSRMDDKKIDNVVNQVHRSTGFHYPRRRRPIVIGAGVLLLLTISGMAIAKAGFSKPEVQYLRVSSPAENFSEELPDVAEPFDMELRVSELDFTEIDASSVYAYNPESHQVYYEKNIDEKRQIASITKLMTATVVIDQYDFEKEIEVTDEMLESFPDELSHVIGFEDGDKLSVQELYDAMMINSFNDAAVLLAVLHPSGYDGFVAEMNSRAEQLGMANTKFANPQGFDSDNSYSTARDVQRLVGYAMQYEEIMSAAQTVSSQMTIEHANGEVEQVDLESTNKLLGRLKYMKGLKTGYTAEAGPSLVGYFDAGAEEKLVTIVLGGNDNRFDLTEELYYLLGKSYSPPPR
ncbi:MAG: serine hydrolase [Candidatus Dojkabacteria bacterium]|nr:MAG: serine hydrolase [Candidatus Dojkabacteria bacterium]